MKKETAEQKLMALLMGASPEQAEALNKAAEKAKQAEIRRKGSLEGVSEDRIKDLRQAQGITYFLQAPELFKRKECNRCGDPFLVSRLYVAYCSYECIRLSLEALGIKWRKGDDLEALANDPQVWDGNEPLWINNLTQLEKALQTILGQTSSESQSLPPKTSPEVSNSSTTSKVTSSSLLTLLAKSDGTSGGLKK